jgi:hypothetical protein
MIPELLAFRASLPPGPDIDIEPAMHLTDHARRRAEEMGIDVAEVEAVFLQPEIERTAEDPERRMLVGGRLALIVYHGTATVVTVLWRDYNRYERAVS